MKAEAMRGRAAAVVKARLAKGLGGGPTHLLEQRGSVERRLFAAGQALGAHHADGPNLREPRVAPQASLEHGTWGHDTNQAQS